MPNRTLRVVPAPEPTASPDGAAVAAREFAIAAMTVVLEVIDRRRPVTALRRFVIPAVTDHVLSRGRARYEARGAAGSGRGPSSAPRLRRVHIQLVADGTAEFFGSYQCGDRIRAFAGRLAVTKSQGRPAWQVQSLMLD